MEVFVFTAVSSGWQIVGAPQEASRPMAFIQWSCGLLEAMSAFYVTRDHMAHSGPLAFTRVHWHSLGSIGIHSGPLALTRVSSVCICNLES